jgi:hypothetical protein
VVCPLINHGLRHLIVKIVVESRGAADWGEQWLIGRTFALRLSISEDGNILRARSRVLYRFKKNHKCNIKLSLASIYYDMNTLEVIGHSKSQSAPPYVPYLVLYNPHASFYITVYRHARPLYSLNIASKALYLKHVYETCYRKRGVAG